MRNQVKRIHFVGIGGSGMSGIAEVLVNLGYEVSGSDIQRGVVVDRLEKAGVVVNIGHHESAVEGVDVVVVSSAIDRQNPEVAAALDQKIPTIPRAEMLGELMRFQKGIAIAGTHGKTTTTSYTAAILQAAGLDPTFVVGGLVNSANANAGLGKGEYLVAEADESDASFLNLQPDIVVVTNIDADHMSTYGGSFDKLRDTFLAFIKNIPFYGLAVLCEDDEHLRELKPQIHKPIRTYGFSESADVRAANVQQEGTSMRFDVLVDGEKQLPQISLAMPGLHNVQNALAAITVALHLGAEGNAINEALGLFKGIGRRFQTLGSMPLNKNGKTIAGSALVVDDYAHHPIELRATISAAKGCWLDKRLVVVFQPHRYSRTYELFDDFVNELADIPHLVICEVYPAGEKPIHGADGRSLCRAIRDRGKASPVFVPAISELKSTLNDYLLDGDVVLALGAGDIGKEAQTLVSEIVEVAKAKATQFKKSPADQNKTIPQESEHG